MICIEVDPTNPGQYFGCCGLFELAHRLWPQAQARFVGGSFEVSHGELEELLGVLGEVELSSMDVKDRMAPPLWLGGRMGMRLDWWQDRLSGGYELKPWAGTMQCLRIALAMKRELLASTGTDLFSQGSVVLTDDGKKAEPFYFDARRGANSLPLDIGFSPDALKLKSIAYPATEFLTLVGLQRFRPEIVRTRVFSYRAWDEELPIALAALAAAKALQCSGATYQFENAFRTDQRKHKAFTSATSLNTERESS